MFVKRIRQTAIVTIRTTIDYQFIRKIIVLTYLTGICLDFVSIYHITAAPTEKPNHNSYSVILSPYWQRRVQGQNTYAVYYFGQ